MFYLSTITSLAVAIKYDSQRFIKKLNVIFEEK